jgi:tRNA threonylcarbamoyl adenosine modification protein YeaZ
VLLALDTATPAVTVALADGDRVLAGRTTVDARRHGELLAPAIAAVLAEAGVDRTALTGVAVGTGPGPFTGLRVGLVTARTLGAALGIPVVGVCTLDVLALGSGLDGEFRVVTDARRREVHWAGYRSGAAGPVRTSGPYVETPAVAAYDGPAAGAGAALYPDAFPGHREPLHPSAADLAVWVARGLPTTGPDPLYLRRPDAAEPGARKSVLARPAP